MQGTELVSLRGPVPTPKQLGYRMPAEWEPQEAVWLVWPRDPLTWPGRVDGARKTFLQAMKAVSAHQRVDLVVHHDLHEEAKKAVASAGIKDVHFHPLDHQDSWIRDYGPIYLTKGTGPRERMAVRFQFNAWGNKYDALLKDETVIRQLGPRLGSKVHAVEMVLEGGSVDVDGQGCLLTTQQCLLNPNRNPDMTQREIERHLEEYLGIDKVVWLRDGIRGDDTDGHVDDIARFVAPTLVAAAVEEDPKHPNFAPLDENLDILRRSVDNHKRPLRVVEIPMPRDQMTDDGEVLPASHANFLITNGAVLMPTFGGPSDIAAQRRLQQCFKDRPVVPLDCRDLIFGMGAIHCLSQQVPATKAAAQRSTVDEIRDTVRVQGVRSDRLAHD